MIALIRTVDISPGQAGTAMAFAKDMAVYLRDNYDIKVEVLRPFGGNPQRVGWYVRYADLGALEKVSDKLTTDVKYQEKIATASGSFIAGSMHDDIWQTQ